MPGSRLRSTGPSAKPLRGIALVVACVLAAFDAFAQERLCLVVGIADGDTLTARCGEPGDYWQLRVRIAGIDAPEKRQAYGERARQALSDLTFQRWARLECVTADRYGRSVCHVWVAPPSAPQSPATLDVGLALLRQGMAWWYLQYAGPDSPARRQYEQAESAARVAGLGLWRDADAVPPWIWRRQSH